VGYLRWVLDNCHDILSLDLRRSIQGILLEEAADRPRADSTSERSPPAGWASVLKTWYAGLAMQYHPDRGGTHEQMIVVNACYDRLRRMVQVR
jgi:hypothetical protein